jgi:hypothetical protein
MESFRVIKVIDLPTDFTDSEGRYGPSFFANVKIRYFLYMPGYV